MAAWLKHIENCSRNVRDENHSMATYDFTWLWAELPTERLRKHTAHIAISTTL